MAAERATAEVEPAALAEILLVNALPPLRISDRYADLVKPTGMVALMSSSLGSITLQGGGATRRIKPARPSSTWGWAALRRDASKDGHGWGSIPAGRRPV